MGQNPLLRYRWAAEAVAAAEEQEQAQEHAPMSRDRER